MRVLRSGLLFFLTVFLSLLAYDSLLPPISTLMMTRTLTAQPATRHAVPMTRISSHMIRAVIAAEDGKFCRHHGVDWAALQTAVDDVREGDEGAHGASTLTMQVTKNLFLWPGRSYLRKGIEIPLALGLDALWSKGRIMQSYLTVAEFGSGIFGVEAAAHYYFHTTAQRLTPHQVALLAATLPNPKRRNPARPSGYMLNYAATIERRAGQQDVSCLK